MNPIDVVQKSASRKFAAEGAEIPPERRGNAELFCESFAAALPQLPRAGMLTPKISKCVERDALSVQSHQNPNIECRINTSSRP